MGNDCKVHVLSSGRVLSVTYRPQKVGERFGYGLYISDSEKESRSGHTAAGAIDN
jgi:hypothetical protein